MTPKEKAKDLVDRYYNLFSVELENTICYREAKKCALIAVDEILKVLHTNIENRYWQQVKQEIELL